MIEVDVPLLFQMWTSGVEVRDIGARLGVSGNSVYRIAKRYGLPPRPRVQKHQQPDPTPSEIERLKAELKAKHIAERRALGGNWRRA